ncbi:hypothetical protein IPJ70_02560 [Candidatus Campbellbacteria bacterium]|nr:MAG: hypothetical protein IPJ70_02560 [Candidatus Campbellbacteria bacterium]
MNLPSVPQLSSGSSSMKDFVAKKEKVVGALTLAAIVAAVTFGIGPLVLPSIVSTLGLISTSFSYMTAIAIKAALLGGAVWVAIQPGTRTLGWHIYRRLAKKMSLWILRMNPAEHAKLYAHEYLGTQLNNLVSALSRLVAIVKERERAIAVTKEQIETARRTAEALKSRHYDDKTGRWSSEEKSAQFREASFEYEMRSKSLKKFEFQLELLKKRQVVLEKFVQAYKFYIRMIQLTVEIMTAEFKASEETREAVNIVSSTLGGGNSQAEFFALSMEYMGEQIAQSEAEVEVFMRMTPEFTGSYELEGDMAEDKMFAELSKMDEFDARATNLLDRAASEQRLLTEGGVSGLAQVITTPQQREPLLVAR